MAYTRDVNLKFNNADTVINNAKQLFTGDVEFSSTVTISGDLDFSGAQTFEELITAEKGLDVSTVGIDVIAGDIDMTAGDINITVGDISVAQGNVEILDTAGTGTEGFLTVENDLTVTAGDVEVTTGDITLVAGSLTAAAAINAGTVVELADQAAVVPPVAALAGTLTSVNEELYYRTATYGDILLSDWVSQVLTVAGGATGNMCVVTVPDGYVCALHGTLVAHDATAGAFAMAEITGYASAAAGATTLQDTSVTVHNDGITIAAPVVAVAGDTVFVTVSAHAANETRFSVKLKVHNVAI